MQPIVNILPSDTAYIVFIPADVLARMEPYLQQQDLVFTELKNIPDTYCFAMNNYAEKYRACGYQGKSELKTIKIRVLPQDIFRASLPFLNPEKGYFNAVLQQFGHEGIAWYTEKAYWSFIIIFMSQWKGIGYNTVVYLASICGINKTYYEAAVLDGATKWQQIKYITIPLLKPVITILLIMAVGGIFKADFGLFYQLPMNSGPLYPVTNVLDTYIFRALQTNGEIGMSSAAALFQSTVGFILIMIANKIVSKIDNENALF